MSTLIVTAKRLLLLFALAVASLFALVIVIGILMALGIVTPPPQPPPKKLVAVAAPAAEPAHAVAPPAPPARPAPAPAPKPAAPTCVIRIPGEPSMAVPALPTEEGFDEYGRAAAQHLSDLDLMRVLVANRGKLIDAGTRCAWADVGIMTTRARMLEGMFAGQAFYFPTEWTRGAK